MRDLLCARGNLPFGLIANQRGVGRRGVKVSERRVCSKALPARGVIIARIELLVRTLGWCVGLFLSQGTAVAAPRCLRWAHL